MASMNVPVRLSAARVAAAALVLARAFQEDAGTVYMIPSMVERSRGLPFLFTPTIRYVLAHGEGYISESGDTDVTLMAAGSAPSSVTDLIGMGLLPVGDCHAGALLSIASQRRERC